MSSGNSVGPIRKHREFASTQWSVVRAAGSEDAEISRSALQELCQLYWYPLYSFVRRQGNDSASAADLTQAFFADLLQRQDLKKVDPELGKFRSFLLAAIKNFILNQWEKERALKRGGGQPLLSMDFSDANRRYLQIPKDRLTPELHFERQWAVTLLDRVQKRQRKEFEQRGRAHVFDKLTGFLAGKNDEMTLADAAAQLSMTEVAAKVAVHRMRTRFAELLRTEIRSTVGTDAEVDAEIQHLFSVLRN